jgi:hypothetical protein
VAAWRAATIEVGPRSGLRPTHPSEATTMRFYTQQHRFYADGACPLKTATAPTAGTILAIDLGRFKSVAGRSAPSTRAAPTSPIPVAAVADMKASSGPE